MYEEFFGLARKPFELVPNPDFLYLSRTHSKVGIYLDYAMKENTGFILLTGEVGSGKTTIIRDLLKKLGPDVQVAKVFNTKLTSEQMIATINDDFGLEIGGKNKVQLLKELYQFLIEQYGLKRRSVLIIDEAQNLSIDSLEELRMLSNLETNDSKLLQIVMVGQPELKRILSIPQLRQLRQRISIHCHLQPLSRAETDEYVLHRLEVAGNREAVNFSGESLGLVHEFCGGIPRLINIMCDFLLLSAFAEGSRSISEQMVAEVAGDPQFEGQFFPRQSPLSILAPDLDPPTPTPPRPTVAEAKVAAKVPERPSFHLPPAELECLCQRLDCFETSIQEVRSRLLSQPTEPARGISWGEEDLVLNMPRLDPSMRKPGLLDGFRKLFLKSFFS